MNSKNINQAMVNRANASYEIKTLNNRINSIVDRVNGVDIVFRPNELISGNVISDLISGIDNIGWISAALISNATVYEAPAPSPSSYINNLRPAGMWKGHVTDTDGTFIADTYSPLESFVRDQNGSVMFSLIQPGVADPAAKNYGGNLPNNIVRLITGITSDNKMEVISSILSNIASSDFLNINNLYYIQNIDNIATQIGGTAESFTLHFE